MKTLGIETSTLTGSVALVEDGRLLGETTLSVSVRHSERLMPAIEHLLRDAEVAPSEIDLFAVAEGPGSFTGLRIGIAAAQGLALAHGRPVAGVSTLKGLAMNAAVFPGLVVPLLNAFRGEVYFGVYRMEGGRPVPVQEDAVLPVAAFLERFRSLEGDTLFLGDGVGLLKGDGDPMKGRMAPALFDAPRAANIALLAEGSSPSAVLPRYLRKPV
ncbi:MAG TPA: tRNA (adenosine(37)-N6)-threonylcarbamoyltransferase complex dimerization subunit type 1 TsaB [bacterium]|nr:tRNA (adenosine(37)-N6)-threonylcarbamoyltransferase complex dimerization subunit type 1 TsaB [bacterium]